MSMCSVAASSSAQGALRTVQYNHMRCVQNVAMEISEQWPTADEPFGGVLKVGFSKWRVPSSV